MIVSSDLDEREALTPGLIVDVVGFGTSGVVSERYRGDEDFQLSMLEPSANAFVAVEYVEGLPELMTTLTLLDLSTTTRVVLGGLQRRVLEEIVDRGGLSQVATLDQSKAHAFISVVDPGGLPLQEVRVTRHSAESAAYDAGATYSDQLLATQFRGVILLVNIEADEFPGSESEVVVSDGRNDARLRFPVVQDSVTLATVTLGN